MMIKMNLKIWNRQFRLKVIYDCYDDEEITDIQNEAAERFQTDTDNIDKSLQHVKKYCLKDNNMAGVKEIDNIFKYVMPRAVYIQRNNKKRVVAILCDYTFDVEHGLAIVFENEKFKKIVSESDL